MKNKKWVLLFMIVCTAAGLFPILIDGGPTGLGVIWIGIVYLMMLAVTLMLQIIVHEGGHCLGGLASGYEFASFRILNWMIIKKDGMYLRKKFKIVGTGGQCLMAPPAPYHPDYPYRLYHLSGGLANLITAGGCLLLAYLFSVGDNTFTWGLLFLMPMAVTGIYCGGTNLVPMFVGGVANDGWNVTHLGQEPNARRILWLLLDVMAKMTKGNRFRDFPEEWFQPGENPDYRDYYQCAVGVYRFSYLMDVQRLAEAQSLAKTILDVGEEIPQIYRYELFCESIFLELIEATGQPCRLDQIERWYTPELNRYVKATASYPQRQRLNYGMAKLYHHDEEAADKALKKFIDACKTYPNAGEVESEWELIGLVDCKQAEVL
jgi:hypothetical protein